MEQTVKSLIARKKIIAICRGIYGDGLMKLTAALHRGGIDMIEVTFDQADAENLRKTSEAIRMLEAEFPGMAIGAGTVVTTEQLESAAAGGAKFIVSPNTDPRIIQESKRMGLVSIPGAMTPSEIALAWQSGADFVKLFPCAQLGVDYVKAVRSPLNNIPLLATGGIDAENLDSYLSIGMAGAGMGGRLCNKKLIQAGHFDELEEHARACAAIAEGYPAFC